MYSGNNYFAARSEVLQLGEAVVVKSELHDIDIPCRVALIEPNDPMQGYNTYYLVSDYSDLNDKFDPRIGYFHCVIIDK